MKHRIAVSISLALVVLACILMRSDQTVAGQQALHQFDTGIITLGNDQLLRITVNGMGGNDRVAVRFRQMTYGQEQCNNDGVCRRTVMDQNTSAPVNIGLDEGASIAVDPSDPSGNTVRAIVLSNTKNVTVNASIVNTLNGQIDSFFFNIEALP